MECVELAPAFDRPWHAIAGASSAHSIRFARFARGFSGKCVAPKSGPLNCNQAFPRGSPRIKQNRPADNPAYLRPAGLDSLLRIQEVARPQQTDGFQPDENRPGTSQPDSHTASRQRIGIGPTDAQMG